MGPAKWDGTYCATFAASTALADLAAACTELWGVPADRILIDNDDTGWPPERTFLVAIDAGHRPGSQFDVAFTGVSELRALSGHGSELALATELCVHLGTRALVMAPGSFTGNVEVLVTEDGWHGGISTTETETDRLLSLDYAFDPVPLMPWLPVIDPAYVAQVLAQGSTFGAPIPEAGWLTPSGDHAPTPTVPSRYRPEHPQADGTGRAAAFTAWHTTYRITFASTTPPEQLAEACAVVWEMFPERIHTTIIGESEETPTSEPYIVEIVSGRRRGSQFDRELSGGPALGALCEGRSELVLATEICVHLGTRALVTVPGGDTGPFRVLVTEDGWHGTVVMVTDTESQHQSIGYAFAPVPAAPEIPVIDPAAALSVEGVDLGMPIPEAGWLTPSGEHSPAPTAPSRYRRELAPPEAA